MKSLTIVLLTALITGSCSASLDRSQNLSNTQDFCSYIGGTGFVSIEAFSSGGGANDITSRHRTIRFDGYGGNIDQGKFFQEIGDSKSRATYRCNDSGTIIVDTQGGPVSGLYNMHNHVLEFDGMKYVKDDGTLLDPCRFLQTALFVSENKDDTHHSPDGPTSFYGSLLLAGGTFHLVFSDGGRRGRVRCNPDDGQRALTLIPESGVALSTEFDFRTHVLTVAQQRYIKQPAVPPHTGQEHQNGGKTPDL